MPNGGDLEPKKPPPAQAPERILDPAGPPVPPPGEGEEPPSPFEPTPVPGAQPGPTPHEVD